LIDIQSSPIGEVQHGKDLRTDWGARSMSIQNRSINHIFGKFTIEFDTAINQTASWMCVKDSGVNNFLSNALDGNEDRHDNNDWGLVFSFVCRRFFFIVDFDVVSRKLKIEHLAVLKCSSDERSSKTTQRDCIGTAEPEMRMKILLTVNGSFILELLAIDFITRFRLTVDLIRD
jgi:hypothetical protein